VRPALNFVSLCLIALFTFCRRKPEIDFCKENIIIEIENDHAKVTGNYYFENTTSIRKQVKFYYPFPVDSNHSYPDIILIDYPFEKDSSGIYFTMSIDKYKTDSFKIIYDQRLKKNRFCYITTTTRRWKRPIKEANFVIIMPDSLVIKTNYKMTDKKKMGNKYRYYIKRRIFYPKNDLIVEWR